MDDDFKGVIDASVAEIRRDHSELAKRVSTLEETVFDLQARVERLEGSTH